MKLRYFKPDYNFEQLYTEGPGNYGNSKSNLRNDKLL